MTWKFATRQIRTNSTSEDYAIQYVIGCIVRALPELKVGNFSCRYDMHSQY